MDLEVVLPDKVNDAITDLIQFVNSKYGFEPERVYLRTEHFPYEELQMIEMTKEDGSVVICCERKLDEHTISAIIEVGLLWIETGEVEKKRN